LFRDTDRDSMISAFDLFNSSDASDNAGAIVGSLRSGQMPREGAWPDADLDRLERWIDAGKPG
jgi:hypothetical protein